MSIHRRAAKRDAVEPAIIATLRAHGAVVWQMSGAGITDTLVFYRRRLGRSMDRERRTFVAEIKGAKGKPTPAQVKRWTELANYGFSVFILRTPEDAVAMLNNALSPWEPERCDCHKKNVACIHVAKRILRNRGDGGKGRKRMKADASPELMAAFKVLLPGYNPPRSTPVDAAKEAEVFASPEMVTRECGCIGRKHRLACLSEVFD